MAGQHKYPEAERRKVCLQVTKRVSEGIGFTAACKSLGYNQTTVAEWFVKLDIPRPAVKKERPPRGKKRSIVPTFDLMAATDYLDKLERMS